MSKTETAKAETKMRYVVLGVSRRDLLMVLSSEDQDEAMKVAEAGVMQSKFSDTIVLEVAAHFSEAAVRWKNPDGVEHKPEVGAQLNPGNGEQELPPGERTSDKPEVSKRDNIEADAEASPKGPDTGHRPDQTTTTEAAQPGSLAAKSPAFDAPSEGGGAKSGVQSSSDLKAGAGSSKPK